MPFMTTLPSPVGTLTLASDGEALTGPWLEGQKYFGAGLPDTAVRAAELPVFQAAEAWLAAYFSKSPLPALPPLAPRGTPFQQEVWRALCAIPYGQTRSYGQLAAALGRPSAARAVGGACRRNPIWLMIPCHRVVGASGSLTGYAGGLERKKALLALEQGQAVQPHSTL